jgi:hypothetical protein
MRRFGRAARPAAAQAENGDNHATPARGRTKF